MPLNGVVRGGDQANYTIPPPEVLQIFRENPQSCTTTTSNQCTDTSETAGGKFICSQRGELNEVEVHTSPNRTCIESTN